MAKRIILGIVAVFVAWSVLDYVLHQLILGPSYAATAHLWRPMEEMKMGLMNVVRLLAAIFFTLIYACLVSPKCTGRGVKYGLLFGLGTGVSMGYGTYSVMAIPYNMALAWFLGSVVEATAGGLLAGLIVKGQAPESTGGQ